MKHQSVINIFSSNHQLFESGDAELLPGLLDLLHVRLELGLHVLQSLLLLVPVCLGHILKLIEKVQILFLLNRSHVVIFSKFLTILIASPWGPEGGGAWGENILRNILFVSKKSQDI
jgi:hypothetical protein